MLYVKNSFIISPICSEQIHKLKFVETHKLCDLQTTGAAIYNTHRYSKMTWASIYWWSHFAGKTFFLNSHLHHSFPTWDNDAHTLFSISFFSFEISAFTFLLFSFRAYVFYAYLCVCVYGGIGRQERTMPHLAPFAMSCQNYTFIFGNCHNSLTGMMSVANVFLGMHIIQLRRGWARRVRFVRFIFPLLRCKWQKIHSHYSILYTNRMNYEPPLHYTIQIW